MIISGGVNIYPQEIEDVLVMHLGVADVAVIGAPDEEMGESVMAVVQPTDPDADEDALAAELDALCRSQLAGFKCPRQYRFTASLPRLPTGKLLKRVVREEFGGSSAGSVVGA
jgi:long-chain acyl-CoA synthetase